MPRAIEQDCFIHLYSWIHRFLVEQGKIEEDQFEAFFWGMKHNTTQERTK